VRESIEPRAGALASQAAPQCEFALCYARIDHKPRVTSFSICKDALHGNAGDAFLEQRRRVSNKVSSDAALRFV